MRALALITFGYLIGSRPDPTPNEILCGLALVAGLLIHQARKR